MNASEFRQRFMLQPPPPAEPEIKATSAAVLVPVIDYGNQLTILFTERALHLRHHPGQISFPGGRTEQHEHTADTALREAQEETGLPPNQVELLGRLNGYYTRTGFWITPWVGLVKPQTRWQLQPDEVSAIFEAPLNYFLQPQNRSQLTLPLFGEQHTLHFMPYQGKLIWGATAAILYQLCQQLGTNINRP